MEYNDSFIFHLLIQTCRLQVSSAFSVGAFVFLEFPIPWISIASVASYSPQLENLVLTSGDLAADLEEVYPTRSAPHIHIRYLSLQK